MEAIRDLAGPDGFVRGATLAAETARRLGQPVHSIFRLSRFSDFLRIHCPQALLQLTPGADLQVGIRDTAQANTTEPPTDRSNESSEIEFLQVPSPWNEWLTGLLSQRIARRPQPATSTTNAGNQRTDTTLTGSDLATHTQSCLSRISQHQPAPLESLRLVLKRETQQSARSNSATAIHAALLLDWASPETESVTLQTAASAARGDAVVDQTNEYSPSFIRNLALICSRAETLRSEFSTEILGGKGSLYFRVREAARNLIGADKDTDGHQVFPALLDRYTTRLRSATNAAASTGTGGANGVRLALPRLMQEMGRLKPFLLPDESEAWESALEVISEANRCLDRLNDSTETDASELALTLHSVLSRWRSAEAMTQACGPTLHMSAHTALQLARPVLSGLLSDFSGQIRPQIHLEHAQRRYPLTRRGGAMSIPFSVTNGGGGAAKEIQLHFSTNAPGVSLSRSSHTIKSLAPGHSWTSTLEADCSKALRYLAINAAFSFTDALNEAHRSQDSLRIENDLHDAHTNWSSLLEARPYALNPIDRTGTLWGRQTQITELLTTLQTGTSTILWGQKRVGKTSVARVVFRQLETRRDAVPLFLRKGDLAGYTEGEIGREISERLVTYCARHRLITSNPPIPSLADFAGRLTRLTRLVDDLQDLGLRHQIILILDEFDELPVDMYTGDRGDYFFGTLRALTERNVAFILVGSERIPTIIQQHSQLLNKYKVQRLDFIRDRDDIFQIISEPVRGVIEYDPEALDRIASLTSGNPYYINLLCLRILHAMVDSRRTYVDAADVQSAAAELCAEQSPSHWSHFWEDSPNVTIRERTNFQVAFTLVLSLFANRPLERGFHPSELEARIDKQRSLTAPLYSVIDMLVGRGVLYTEGHGIALRYNVRPKLLRWWLCEGGELTINGAGSLPVPPQPVATQAPPTLTTEEFPLTDEDILAVSEGLAYRGKVVDGMQIRLWLKQFRTRDHMLLAFRILRAMRERYYFDPSAVSLMLEKAVAKANEHLLAQRANLELPLGTESATEGRDSIYVAFLGDPLKSGAEYARMANKIARVKRCGTLQAGLEWCATRTGPRVVLIVDDFVGSGAQAVREIRKALKTHQARANPTASLDKRHLLFVPLAASEMGLDELGDMVPEVTSEPVKVLDESDMAFSPNSAIFEDDETRAQAKELFAAIGDDLNPDHPLGWEGIESLVVFPYSVPNATLPALWRPGVHNGVPWKPLFPR